MSKRLLSALFPNFVKKEHIQSQRLSQGPFGAGLKKGRKYLKPGEQAPEGANVQTGPQGGQYYDEMGGGGASAPDAAQGGYDIDYGDPERSAQVREDLDQEGMGVPPAPEAGPEISEDRNVVGGIDYGPAKPEIKPEDVDYGPADKGTPALQDSTDYLKGTADAWAEQMTNDPAFTGSEAQIDAAVADLESEIKSQDSDLTNQAAEFDPANSHLDHSNGDIDDDGNWTAPLNEESQQLVDEFRDKLSSGGGAQSPMIPNPGGYEEGTNYTDTQVVNPDIPDTIPNPGGFETGNYTDNEIPNPAKYPSTTGPTATPDVSEATFDGQGNIQTPGSDPYPVSEMISEGTDSESLSHLIDAYQNESGGKQSVPGILSEGYSGPLNRDSFEDSISNNQSEDFYITDNDYEDAIGFFDWLGSKAGTDTSAVDEDGFPAGSSPTGEERRAKRDSAFIGGGAQGFNRESGQTSPPEQKEYDGYVGARAVEAEKKANEFIEGVGDHLMDQATSNDPAEISDAIDGYAASRAYFPGSETYDKLQDAGQRFMAERKDESADYYGEDYALMAKMMQKHNINNRRSDPVILSNKGGRQRK